MPRSKDPAALEMRPPETETAVPVHLVFEHGPVEPFSMSPGEVQTVFGVGHTKFYRDIIQELETFKEGSLTRITTRSVKARLARLLAGGR